MTTKESRRDPRSRALNLTVRYKSATVADFVEDHSYDISRGGLFIKTANPFATGTLLKFEVRIVGEKTVIDGVGRVAWRREKNLGPGKPAGMGIKFIRIDDACVQVIEHAVARHESSTNQFEEGAREQGVMLSEPPANLRGETPQPQEVSPASSAAESDLRRAPMFPAQNRSDIPLEDASEQSMLFQTSELLKSALNKVSPEAKVDAGTKQPEITKAEIHDHDDVTAEDRATLPTGSSKIPPPAVKLVGTSKRDEATTDEDDTNDVDDGDEADDSDELAAAEAGGGRDATSEPPGSGTDARRSKRPGTGKKKNPKKKKRKFSYTSLPAAKQTRSTVSTTPPADASSSTSPARHRSEFPAPAAANSNTSSFWWVASLALVAISGALYLAFSSPEPTAARQDTSVVDSTPASELAAATPSVVAPAALEPSPQTTDLVATATTSSDPSSGSSSTSDGSSSTNASDSTSSTDTATPLLATAEAATSEPLDVTSPSVESEPRTRRARNRRRVKPEAVVEPAALAPTAAVTPAVATPVVPVAPPPQAPTAPQAPVPPQVPLAPSPVAPPPVAPPTVSSPPRAPVAPAPAQPTPAVPTPAAPHAPAPATAPRAPTTTPAPIPAPAMPQGQQAAPAPTRLP
jgi:uncharacterized protein (TIGR02266 family)